MSILFSIIMPTYNRKSCIKKAIDSLLTQTYQNLELIVVDDGSTDGTGKYLKNNYKEEIVKRKIRYFKLSENKGAAFARNEGLKKAKYNWIGYLDTDNLMYDDFLATFADSIKRNRNHDIFYAQMKCRRSQAINGHVFNFDELVQFNYIDLGIFVHSVRIYKGLGGFDIKLKRLSDWDLIIKYTEKNSPIFIEKILLDYYDDPASLRISNNASFDEAYKHVILNYFKRTPAPIFLEKYTGQGQRLKQAVADRDAQIIERDGQISGLARDVRARDGQITALYKSTSWRITQPVRMVGHQIKRVRQVAELAAPAIKLSGGLDSAMKKAIRVYRREGLAGIKRCFRTVAASRQTRPFGECNRNDYFEWIRRYDTLTDESRSAISDRIDNFNHKPLISVVMPTYNSKPEWLIEAIESVRKQLYTYWELCIADDASTDKRIRPILERYAREDTRIKIVFREKNGHISAASNSALMLAVGEWVALLDHDDLLAEDALFLVADVVNRHPQARLIYSDEDRVNEHGQRFEPYFKCDWNVDLFYSQNMFSHLGVYHTALLREIGGFRDGLEGSQDYDLALRCVERIEPKQIHHIPRVLYHWRMHAESTAKSVDAKPYALLAGQRALNDHFKRQNVNARAEFVGVGYRVCYALPSSPPLVSIIVITGSGRRMIQQCIRNVLKKTIYAHYEVLIIDTGSDDQATREYYGSLKSEAHVRIIRNSKPVNCSALLNTAVKSAKGEIIALINSNIEVISPEWLSEMVSHVMRPGIGAVGARIWYTDNTLRHAGIILGLGEAGVGDYLNYRMPRGQNGYFGRANLIQSFSAVTSACLVIRKSVYEDVGGFNEEVLQEPFSDIDFCLRLGKADYRNIWTPYAEVYQHEPAARDNENTPARQKQLAEEAEYMKQQWGDILQSDPAYSPNLTMDHEDCSLAWPPRVDLPVPPHAQVVQLQDKLNRVDKALFLVDRKGLGLEIGPSHNPLAPKKDFLNVQILDHATREDLIEKYRRQNVNLDNIEEVDYVWHGEPLQELIGKTGCYDWIVASHVIEHVPDLTSFLQECEALLKPAGILSLVIPDKRYCFDYFSSSSSTGSVLDAHADRRLRPSHGQIFDHLVNTIRRNGNSAWSTAEIGEVFEFFHTFDEAHAIWKRMVSSKDYIDTHCWKFTPASFRLLISDLQGLGLIGLEIKAEFDTAGCEFFVALGKKCDVPLKVDRLEILQARRLENV